MLLKIQLYTVCGFLKLNLHYFTTKREWINANHINPLQHFQKKKKKNIKVLATIFRIEENYVILSDCFLLSLYNFENFSFHFRYSFEPKEIGQMNITDFFKNIFNKKWK